MKCIAGIEGEAEMLPPDQDLKDRKPIWDALQVFWMDTNPKHDFPWVVKVCAESKYTIEELGQIYWNEVWPAVRINLYFFIAPEWAGFNIKFLTERVLKKHRYGKRLPIAAYTWHSNGWWRKLKKAVERERLGKTI